MIINNNRCISRVPFHVKHAQMYEQNWMKRYEQNWLKCLNMMSSLEVFATSSVLNTTDYNLCVESMSLIWIWIKMIINS